MSSSGPGEEGPATGERELLAAVDTAFVVTARGLAPPWPDPHEGRSPTDDEYSRVSDPAKFRLLGARAEAWASRLAEQGMATRGHDVAWSEPPGTIVTRAERLDPRQPDALPLVIARSMIGDIPDAGVTLGVGHPAAFLAACPACGCDACDLGAQEELDRLDRLVLGVVSGRIDNLAQGERRISGVPWYRVRE